MQHETTRRPFWTLMKNVSLCNDQCKAGRPAGRMSACGNNFNVAIFSDTINTINVKLCMMVVLTELYPFIPLSVVLIVFQGHSNVSNSFNLKSYVLIRLS